MQSNYLHKVWDTSILENCFLMYPKTTGDELLKYAVIELIMSGVLSLKREKRKPNPQAQITRYFYLKKGPNYGDSEVKHYHFPIIKMFENQTKYLPIRNFGEKVAKYFGEEVSHFKSNFVSQSMKKEGLLRFVFLFTVLTQKGKQVKNELKADFVYAEKQLNELLSSKPKEAIGLINKLDAELILMDNLTHKSARAIASLLGDNSNKIKSDLNIRKIDFVELFEFENSFSTSIDFSTFIGEHRPPDTDV